jgi:Fe-Mn family superoxide dismutase
MTKSPSPNEGSLSDALTKFWGSTDAWLKDFKATGTMRGIGWTILYHDPSSKNLFNAWVNEHDMGHLAGCTPLLVLDVFEHAYIGDYGLKRGDYIDAFIKAIDWKTVENRLKI